MKTLLLVVIIISAGTFAGHAHAQTFNWAPSDLYTSSGGFGAAYFSGVAPITSNFLVPPGNNPNVPPSAAAYPGMCSAAAAAAGLSNSKEYWCMASDAFSTCIYGCSGGSWFQSASIFATQPTSAPTTAANIIGYLISPPVGTLCYNRPILGATNGTSSNCYLYDSGAPSQPDLSATVPPTVTATLGQAIILTGTITNNGTGSTNVSFNSMFGTNLNVSTWNTQMNVSSAALATRQSTAVTTTLPASTFITPGTYFYNLCAGTTNEGATWQLTEPTYNNNCSSVGVITVISTLSASCSVSPTSSQTGSPVTWAASVSGGTAPYTYSWSGTDSLSGATVSVPKTYSTAGAKTGSVTVHSADGQSVSPSCANSAAISALPVATATLYASPTSITTGGSSILTWTSINATSCSIDNGVGTVTPTAGGTVKVYPISATKYTITCIGAGGNGSASATVAVSGIADLHPTALSPLPPTGGTPVTFIGTIQNSGTVDTPSFTSKLFICQVGDASCESQGIAQVNSIIAMAQPSLLNRALAFLTGSVAHGASLVALTLGPTSILAGTSGNQTAQTTYTFPLLGGSYEYILCANDQGVVPVANKTTLCNRWTSLTVNSGASADLTVVGTGGLSPLTATVGTPVTFTATVQNIGSGVSGSFPSVIEIPDSTNVVQTNSISLAGGGASGPVSASYTFPAAGPYQVEICANYNAVGKVRGTNIVTEGGLMYANNCGSPVTVVVTAPPPTVSCTANPTTIAVGGSVAWAATASGGVAPYTYAWGGNVSGSARTVSQIYPSPGTYSGQVTVTDSVGSQTTVQCSPGGSSNPVIVTSCAPSFWATPPTVVQGDSSTLNWSSPAVCSLSCSGYGFTATGGTGNGSTPVTPTPQNNNYALSCSGQPDKNVTINVIVPTVNLTANPTRVSSGGTTNLTWKSTDTTACTVTRNGGGIIGTGLNGSATDPAPITTQTTYTASCSPSGSATAVVNVAPSFTNF